MVNTSVLYILKRSIECFNPYFNPFTLEKAALNLSDTRFNDDEFEILKYGLKNSIAPLHLNKTDMLTTFDVIYRSMSEDVKREKDAEELKAKMPYLAKNYVTAYNSSNIKKVT